MENSIEKIWKEGFLHKDALVAPRLNDLYNQKSQLITDKYKKMFKINIIAIVIGSFVFLLISFLVGIPYMGIALFLLLNSMAFVDKKLLDKLEKIDKKDTSYQYLKSVKNWMNYKNKVNIRMARILYPYVFLSMILGFWFMNIDGAILGETIVNQILSFFPETYLILGVPLFGIIGIIIITVLLAFLAKRLYKSDINLVYGRVFEKIDELVRDMEELRK